MNKAFHTDMKETVHFNGSSSKPFSIFCSSIKQGCLLAPSLFRIFFAVLLKHAFGTATKGIYLFMRADGMLFNLVHLRAKAKICEALMRDVLFAGDAAVATHQ